MPAKLTMFSEVELILDIPHNHEAVPEEADSLEVRTGIKRKASDQTFTPTQNIISEVLSEYNVSDHLLPR